MATFPVRAFLGTLLLASAAQAAGVPLTLSTSGYLLDSDDNPLTQQGVSLRFSVWVDPSSPLDGSRVWPAAGESECLVNIVNGFYTAVFDGSQTSGCGAGLTSEFLPVTQPRYLQVSVGGTTLTPRMRIGTVPNAAFATQSGDAQALIAALAASGAINATTNPVDWSQLKTVPPGFADGTDADTTYAAGSGGGLSLVGNAFSIAAGSVTNAMLAEAYVTATTAAETYATKAGVADAYLTTAAATETYAAKTAVNETYLTKTGAADTYATNAGVAETYLTKQGAVDSYAVKTDLAALQKRVAGTCAVGSYVTAVKEDGSVTCASTPVASATADGLLAKDDKAKLDKTRNPFNMTFTVKDLASSHTTLEPRFSTLLAATNSQFDADDDYAIGNWNAEFTWNIPGGIDVWTSPKSKQHNSRISVYWSVGVGDNPHPNPLPQTRIAILHNCIGAYHWYSTAGPTFDPATPRLFNGDDTMKNLLLEGQSYGVTNYDDMGALIENKPFGTCIGTDRIRIMNLGPNRLHVKGIWAVLHGTEL